MLRTLTFPIALPLRPRLPAAAGRRARGAGLVELDATQVAAATAHARRRRWFWRVAFGLLAAEALAVAVICVWQVRQGQARLAEQRAREAHIARCFEEATGRAISRCRKQFDAKL